MNEMKWPIWRNQIIGERRQSKQAAKVWMVLKKSRYDLFIIRGFLIVIVEGEKRLEADAKEK